MKYASVCSGIEAATVAWHPLGWEPVWFSQFDPEHNYKNGPDFPSRVLQHHYPHVPNLGNMLELRKNKIYNESNFDVLVGGTPCQSFSIAGLRRGMDDERGNLALEFVRILGDKRPQWFVWENVPGVLSSKSGKDGEAEGEEDDEESSGSSADFACLLSAFTGRDVADQKFSKAGIITGDFYSIAWRVLDSQHFGVPQRRRRVFVVGHLGSDWRPPVAVLFERDSLRRDFTPSREARKGAPGVAEGSAPAEGFRMTAFGQYEDDNSASTIKKRDHKDATDLVVQPNQIGVNERVSDTLTANKNQGTSVYGDIVGQPVVYDPTQITSPQNGSNPKPGDPCPPLVKNGHVPIVIDRAGFNQGENALYDPKIEETQTMPTIISRGPHAICYPVYGIKATAIDRKPENGGNGIGYKEEQADTLTKMDRHAVCYKQHFQVASVRPPLIFKIRGGKEGGGKGYLGSEEMAFTVTTGQDQNLFTGFMVRRLTPMECERLQAFPDDYTNIPMEDSKVEWQEEDGVLRKMAPDSKRYSSLGNSMTVYLMRWLGRRIDTYERITTKT